MTTTTHPTVANSSLLRALGGVRDAITVAGHVVNTLKRERDEAVAALDAIRVYLDGDGDPDLNTGPRVRADIRALLPAPSETPARFGAGAPPNASKENRS